MRLTTKGRFAVTAMLDLALRQENGPVTLSGVADMGPMLPLLTGLEPAEREQVAPVARALLQWDRTVD